MTKRKYIIIMELENEKVLKVTILLILLVIISN